MRIIDNNEIINNVNSKLTILFALKDVSVILLVLESTRAFQLFSRYTSSFYAMIYIVAIIVLIIIALIVIYIKRILSEKYSLLHVDDVVSHRIIKKKRVVHNCIIVLISLILTPHISGIGVYSSGLTVCGSCTWRGIAGGHQPC